MTNMSHTERFNLLMKAGEPPKKVKPKQVQIIQIQPRENMNDLQTSISKCTISGNILHLPTERIDNYTDIRKALINAGGKYKNNTFIFSSDPGPLIERLMGGQSVNIKKEFQFFGTPKRVSQMVIDKINFFSRAEVADFSAGQGGLLDLIPKDLNLGVLCVELMPENVTVLKSKGYSRVHEADFLSKLWGKVDIILLNPPFSKNQDIDHFMHAWKHLKDGGQFACITSPHWTFAQDKKSKEFRKFLEDNGATWEEIDPGEFKESGTMIKTILISIIK